MVILSLKKYRRIGGHKFKLVTIDGDFKLACKVCGVIPKISGGHGDCNPEID